MKIAFGTNVLSSPAAGLAVVRRGETEGGVRCASAGRASAAEASAKRQSLASTRQTMTGGGEPAPAANTTVLRGRELPLPIAA